MAGSQWILVGFWLDTSRMVCRCHVDPPKLAPGSSRGGQKWLFSHSRPLGERTIAAVETTNGWISMDIGWIWLGYIQDVPLGPFGPIGIAPGGLHGGSEMAKKCHKMPIYGHKWLRWVQMGPTDHPGCIPPRSNQYPLRSSHLEPPEPLMAINGRFLAFFVDF